jgi:hypothetical protein
MSSITLLGVLCLPILLIAASSFKRALFVFVLLAPWRAAHLFTTIGHTFTLPELALLILFTHVLARILSEGRSLRLPLPALWALAFGVAATLSVLALLLDPATGVSGRPYNIQQGYGAFTLSQVQFGRNAVTQLILRWFFVGALLTVVFALRFEKDRFDWAVRTTVINGLVVGAIGLVYQLSVLLRFEAFPLFLQGIGFNRFPASPNSLGPVPRMYSITGEPGETAHFLLFVLGIVAILHVTGHRRILSERERRLVLPALFTLLLLTTGTTGYGGLFVLIAVSCISIAVTGFRGLRQILAAGSVGALTLFSVLGVLSVVGFVEPVGVVNSQLAKLSFSSSSGSLRARYIAHSLSMFTARPVFGTGVGTQNGTSFLASALAETGLLGGCSLVLAAIYSYRCGIQTAVSERDSVALATATAGISAIGVAFLVRSASASLFPWLWLAFAFPVVAMYHATCED